MLDCNSPVLGCGTATVVCSWMGHNWKVWETASATLLSVLWLNHNKQQWIVTPSPWQQCPELPLQQETRIQQRFHINEASPMMQETGSGPNTWTNCAAATNRTPELKQVLMVLAARPVSCVASLLYKCQMLTQFFFFPGMLCWADLICNRLENWVRISLKTVSDVFTLLYSLLNQIIFKKTKTKTSQ